MFIVNPNLKAMRPYAFIHTRSSTREVLAIGLFEIPLWLPCQDHGDANFRLSQRPESFQTMSNGLRCILRLPRHDFTYRSQCRCTIIHRLISRRTKSRDEVKSALFRRSPKLVTSAADLGDAPCIQSVPHTFGANAAIKNAVGSRSC